MAERDLAVRMLEVMALMRAVEDRMVTMYRQGELLGSLYTGHWHEAIANPTIADAVLDRLVHTAHRIELRGESLRKLRAAKAPRLDETAGS